MSFTKSFPIYRWYCHILIDKVIISTSSNPNEEVDISSEKYTTVKLLVTSILFAICIAGAIAGLVFKQEYIWGSYCVVMAIVALIYFYKFSVVSKTNLIYKSAITKVQFNPSIYPTQHAHFVISFKVDNSLSQKRIIYLTANYANNTDEGIQQALAVMEEEFG